MKNQKDIEKVPEAEEYYDTDKPTKEEILQAIREGARVSSLGEMATAIQSVTGIRKHELLKNWGFWNCRT